MLYVICEESRGDSEPISCTFDHAEAVRIADNNVHHLTAREKTYTDTIIYGCAVDTTTGESPKSLFSRLLDDDILPDAQVYEVVK